MGLIADFKARRVAKRAQAQFELETYQWQSELDLLNTALDIFTNAAKGDEPEDHQLVQKKGELKTAGTSITKLLPAKNMFSPSYEHSMQKSLVIQKLKTFFERFSNL